MDVNPYAPPAELEAAAVAPPAPQTLGEILWRSVALYVNQAPVILALLFTVWAPLQLTLGYIEFFVLDPDADRAQYGSSFWIENLVALLPAGGITTIAHTALTGGRPSLWLALSSAVAAWPRLLGARIVASLVILLSFLAFVLPGLYVATRAALTDQVAILEMANPMLSMQRSFVLTKGYFWRYFFMLALYLSLSLLVGVLLGIPVTLFPEVEPWLLGAIQTFIIYLVAGWVTVALTVAYWASMEEERLLNSHLAAEGELPIRAEDVS